MKRMSERATVRQQTHDLLDSLGGTPAEVAGSLVNLGVRGVPASSRECAIAAYLDAVVSADARIQGVKVCKNEVLVERVGWWRRSVVVTLPAAVRQFVVAFDARQYPGLLRPAAPSTRAPGGSVPPVPHPST